MFGKFSYKDGKKSFIGRKVVLCKKSIKAQRFPVLIENDTRFPCPSVISLGYGRVLNGASWGIVPRCQEKALAYLSTGPPFLFHHVFPLLSNPSSISFFNVQKPYRLICAFAVFLLHVFVILLLQILC